MSEGKLRVGQVGLGYWGRNLARVFDDIADLTWLCDSSDELREEFAQRYPEAEVTAEFGELLSDAFRILRLRRERQIPV